MYFHKENIILNPLAGGETKQFFVDLLVFFVLLGFLSFAFSSFCLIFLASQKTKKHEQPKNLAARRLCFVSYQALLLTQPTCVQACKQQRWPRAGAGSRTATSRAGAGSCGKRTPRLLGK